MKENKKWIQEATNKMKQKGTVGSFREYCGGEVTMECIEKGLKSKDPKIRKKAQFAKNVMSKLRGGEIEKYEYGGLFSVGDILDRILRRESAKSVMNDIDNLYDKYNNTRELIKGQLGMEVNDLDYVDDGGGDDDDKIKKIKELSKTFPGLDSYILNNFKDKYHNLDLDAIKEIKYSNGEKFYVLPYKDEQGRQLYFKIATIDDKEDSNYILKRINLKPEDFEKGVMEVPKFDMGGSTLEGDNASYEGEQQDVQQQSAPSSGEYDISYEEFVDFVGRYPKYFERLIMDLQSQQSGMQ
ncbi:MAG: hypothetical protein KatS3mg002_1346 [Candidatus Woesearchaeota archaeon]|nr:MAG: hypothetical protein KatS3mg002_1346 [Candidatus Woesearchaeota archaeon]